MDAEICRGPSPPFEPSWRTMPNKGQLAILAASRFVDFLQMAALQTFVVHQLRSFDPDLPDSTISHQAGVLQGSFTAAQIITSVLWGRAADQPSIGRKMVLTVGLVGTGIGCIGVGFSSSYRQAVVWRLLTGAIDGTTGAARTMVAECTPRPWHPRAFLLLPAAFNFANVLGPILAAILVNPAYRMPGLFGVGGTFGGMEWVRTYPFALANLLSTVLLFAEAVLVYYGLEETLATKRPLRLVDWSPVRTSRSAQVSGATEKERGSQPTQRLPFSQIWTPNVLWTLLSVAIFDFHMGAFSSLWILFLASPRALPSTSRSAFKFAAGLAFSPLTVGLAMAIIGIVGVALQFLLYPWANARFGLLRCFRLSLLLFPLAYTLAPYLALLPSATPPSLPASGATLWLGLTAVIVLQVTARTFTLPASIILLNNAAPHPTALATVHGIGQACSAAARTLGAMLAGSWYGTWYERGVVGVPWWLTAVVASAGCVAAWWVRDGSGQEI